MWCINNEVLFSYKEEQNCVVCRKMDGYGDHHINTYKPDSERQLSYFFSTMYNLAKKIHESRRGTFRVQGWDRIREKVGKRE
jgi:hypothetical protein